MSAFQTLAAGVILFILLFAGTYLVFKKPIPYAYDNLPSKLNQAMHNKGVHWAKVEVDGDRIYLSGSAPSDEAMVFAKSVVQEETGVSASFIGIRSKSINTKDSDEKENKDIDSWEAFQNENPEGRLQLASGQQDGDTSTASQNKPSGETSGGTVAQAAPRTNKQEDPVDDNPGTLEYRVRVVPKQTCVSEHENPESDFEILFRESTAAMVAESMGELDKLTAYNRDCPVEITILSHGQEAEESLKIRRLDEIRYHLMSSGIEPDDITLK